MELDPVFSLSRIQFGFVISFHIIFPAFTIGLGAWLTTLEGVRLATGNAIYRRVFDFWIKIFALSFGMGVVTGVVMAFQFGTNWGVLAEKTGAIQGPLLGYESFTAFMLEASFFGVMLLGRNRVSPRFYFFACCMVSLGTMFSSFWILVNNSWMQVPIGHSIVNGKIIPADWWAITTGEVMRVRWPHMLLGAFLTTGMCVAATGAWYTLRNIHPAEARVMLNWGLAFVALVIPIQLFFGHLTGEYVLKYQPAKFAAIEARWKSEQPASETLIAIPDGKAEKNLFAISVPKLGSMIASGNWTAREVGLEEFPREDRPPVLIPFFGFRIMAGMGMLMLAISWLGNLLRWRGKPRDDALVSVGNFLRLSVRLHCDFDRLVHSRSRATALGCIRPVAYQRCGDAFVDLGRCALFTNQLYFGLRPIHRQVPLCLHLQIAAQQDRPASRCPSPTPPRVGPWPLPTMLPARRVARRRLRVNHASVKSRYILGRHHCPLHPPLRHPRRLRSAASGILFGLSP